MGEYAEMAKRDEDQARFSGTPPSRGWLTFYECGRFVLNLVAIGLAMGALPALIGPLLGIR